MNTFDLSAYPEQPAFYTDTAFFEQYISADIYQVFLNHLLDNISDAVFLLDHRRQFIAFNKRLMHVLQRKPKDILGHYFSINPIEGFEDSRKEIFLQAEEKLKNGEKIDRLMVIMPPNGKQIFAHIRGIPIKINDDISIYLGLLSDVSQQTKIETSLKNVLEYDQLTGLQNRQNFFTLTSVFIRNIINNADLVEKYQQKLAIVRINIDNLQAFNASIGRLATDMILKAFVKRVKEIEPINCNVQGFSRLGGDDFALLITMNSPADLTNYLEQLQQISHQHFLINGSHIYVHFSMGVALYQGNILTYDTLLHQADKALKQARSTGGNRIVWFDTLDYSPMFNRVHVKSAFTQALKDSQLIAFFQPKICFKNKCLSFEALVRWEHPMLGILSPKDFLDEVLENFSQDLFENIVDYCMTQVNLWDKMGFDVKVAINVDVRQLWHAHFLPFMTDILAKHPTFAKHIEFEITETAQLHNNHQTLAMLNFLHEQGIKLAIDDFGTGYASLSYLLDYPIDTVKFDKIFIQNIHTNERKLKLVKSVIDMVHSLDLTVVAEGVETAEELALLQQIGCDMTQGYFYGKPMSVDETTLWIQDFMTA